MKKFVFTIMLLTSLTSCITTNRVLPTIEDKVFSDPNNPKIELVFPFNIYLDDKQFHYNETVSLVRYKLKTDDSSIEAYIQKERITSGAYKFWGTDDSSKKTHFISTRKKNGYCSTNLIKDNVYSFIEVEVRRYIDDKNLIKANIYHNIGVIQSKQTWKEQNIKLVEKFKDHTKNLCEQIFDNDKI